MTEHTKEPWSVFAEGHTTQIDQGATPHGSRPCAVSWGGFDSTDLSLRKNRANARRIVDCVNALAGISDPAAFVMAAREAEVWLRAISTWLLETDNDMKLPSGVLDTDPLDIAEAFRATGAAK